MVASAAKRRAPVTRVLAADVVFCDTGLPDNVFAIGPENSEQVRNNLTFLF